MGRKNKPTHRAEPPENIRACLTCKRPKCNGYEECMLNRKREMLKKEEANK
jgi:hypothetical protein